MRDDRERLLHIQDAIERIEKYAKKGKEAFARDELIQSWILRHLQIIGEACRAPLPSLKPNILKCPGRTSSACEIFWFMIILGLTSRPFGPPSHVTYRI